jgi:hypothetical protein
MEVKETLRLAMLSDLLKEWNLAWLEANDEN